MENAVIERIKSFIAEKKLSPRAFAQAIGFNYSTLNNYLTGRRSSINNDLIVKIITIFNDISSDWLLTGQGSMLKYSPSSSQYIQNRDGVVAGGSMIVPTHCAPQKKEEKLAQIKAELSGLKGEKKRVDAELSKAKKEVEVLRATIESLTKKNTELHKQLIEEKDRLIKILMEKKVEMES